MKVSEHVMGAGGKRMRPLMTLLVSRMLHDGPNQRANELAAITEMLHTATLVHDDVIDESAMRRGRPTANATWNNATAVLVGDYLIARSFNLLVGFEDMALLKLFSDGTCDIAEGKFCNYNISTIFIPQKQIICKLLMAKLQDYL